MPEPRAPGRPGGAGWGRQAVFPRRGALREDRRPSARPDLPRRPATLGEDLARIAGGCRRGRVDRLSVMDHVWQIRTVGPVEHEMLEAYTTLGFLAAHTSRVKLLALSPASPTATPGLLAKAVTTLDVLSGGRAMLGIGAAWNEEESRGLGLFFPPTAERFERLEEALQICLQMWSGRDGPTRASTTSWPARSTAAVATRRTRRSSSAAVVSRRRCAWWRSTRGLQPVREAGARPQARRAARALRALGPDYDDIEKTALLLRPRPGRRGRRRRPERCALPPTGEGGGWQWGEAVVAQW